MSAREFLQLSQNYYFTFVTESVLATINADSNLDSDNF